MSGWLHPRAQDGGLSWADGVLGTHRLYETVEALARANRLDQLRAVASLRAEPAFRRFGFQRVDTDQVAFNGHAFTVVRMTKRLDRPLPARPSPAGMRPAATSPALMTTRPADDDG